MTRKRREILHTPVKNSAPRKESPARRVSDTEVRVEPIDRVVWMAANKLDANDYNPNVVFTPELRLLERSILTTGWVQPLLINPDSIIIDGFHRWRLSLDSEVLRKQYKGLVPCCIIRVDRPHAMLLTIRMNRAKGAHVAVRMSDVVRRLLNEYDMDPAEIAGEIGATLDEIELLSQENIFKNKNLASYKYSRAWTPRETGGRA
jgi:hypothetical protein